MYLEPSFPLLGLFPLVQLLHPVALSVTPWTAARQASVPFTVSQSLLKFMFIELVMPSNQVTISSSVALFSFAFNLSDYRTKWNHETVAYSPKSSLSVAQAQVLRSQGTQPRPSVSSRVCNLFMWKPGLAAGGPGPRCLQSASSTVPLP